jgi:hypothetical protein
MIAALTTHVSRRPNRPDKASGSHLWGGGIPPWPRLAEVRDSVGVVRTFVVTREVPSVTGASLLVFESVCNEEAGELTGPELFEEPAFSSPFQ